MSTIPKLRRYVIFGANTDVGKTVVTAGLVRAALKNSKFKKVAYCKPLQTGTTRGDSDVQSIITYSSGSFAQKLVAKELFSWSEPVSPHVAAVHDPDKPTDSEVCESIDSFLSQEKACVSFVETAGGVLSPGVQGTPQGDAYCSFLPEAILVGDGRLGGISTTLCALEALQRRQYVIRRIVMIEDDLSLGNSEYIDNHVRSRQCRNGDEPVISIASLPGLPPVNEPLHEWYDETDKMFQAIVDKL